MLDDGHMSDAKPLAADSEGSTQALVLPESVRQRVVTMAAGALTTLSQEDVPAALRRFLRFTPSRRAKLAAAPLSAALATDAEFRAAVGDKVVAAGGDVGAAIAAGTPVPTADPVDVAAIGYLTQSPGWEQFVAAVSPQNSIADNSEQLAALTDQLERARAAAKSEQDRLRRELAAAKQEINQLKAQVRDANAGQRAVQRQLVKIQGDLAAEKGRASAVASEHDALVRRLRSELDRARSSAESARSAHRSTEAANAARIRVLLATISDAAAGLGVELNVADSTHTPADVMAARLESNDASSSHVTAQDEVSRLNALLAIPRMHIIVDGYNVTKTGFAEVSLERQRNRLIRALAGLAAQTGAEITVVFDGTERLTGLVKAPRGVRVLFSHGDQIADELIGDLVHAEPAGRPVTVVSSDKEVIRAALAAGRHTVPSRTLVERISRA